MNSKVKLFYPELSYTITGICFEIHNTLGRFSREKQYGDAIEDKLKDIQIPYQREHQIDAQGNIADFIIDNKILLELKAKRIVTRDDYYQTQRYLQSSGLKLGLIVNFHRQYLVPKRVLLIETEKKSRYI